MNVAIIVGSTRPNRRALYVAQWVHGIASKRTDAQFEIVDIADYNLPLLDEPFPPSMRPKRQSWAASAIVERGPIVATSPWSRRRQ